MSSRETDSIVSIWQGCILLTSLCVFAASARLYSRVPGNIMVKYNLAQGVLIFLSQIILTIYVVTTGLPCPPRQYVGVLATELSNVVIMALVALECYVVWKRKWYKTPLLIGGFLFVLVVTLNTVYLAISPVSRTKEGTCTVGYKKEVGAVFNVFTLLYYVYIYVVTAYKLTAHLTGGGARNQPNNRNFVSTARSVLTVPTSTSGTRSIQSETGQLDASSKLYVLLTCNHRFALAIALVAVFKVINTYFITPAVSLAYGGPIARSLSTIHCVLAHQFVSEVTKPQRKRSRSNSSSSSRSNQSDRSNMSHGTINTNQTSSTLQTQSQSRDHAVIKINKPTKNKSPDVNSYSRSPRSAFVGSQNSGTLDVNSYSRSPHAALAGSPNSATPDLHSYSHSPHTTVAGSPQYNFI